MQKNKRNPSEIISDFIEPIKQSHDNYNSAKNKVDNYNSKTFEWTHMLEDASNKQERNKLATAWRKELVDRRKAKDEMKLWQFIHEFSISEQNKPTLKRLESMLKHQQKTEEYINTPPEEREYKGG